MKVYHLKYQRFIISARKLLAHNKVRVSIHNQQIYCESIMRSFVLRINNPTFR
jgi:ribosomal protein S17